MTSTNCYCRGRRAPQQTVIHAAPCQQRCSDEQHDTPTEAIWQDCWRMPCRGTHTDGVLGQGWRRIEGGRQSGGGRDRSDGGQRHRIMFVRSIRAGGWTKYGGGWVVGWGCAYAIAFLRAAFVISFDLIHFTQYGPPFLIRIIRRKRWFRASPPTQNHSVSVRRSKATKWSNMGHWRNGHMCESETEKMRKVQIEKWTSAGSTQAPKTKPAFNRL